MDTKGNMDGKNGNTEMEKENYRTEEDSIGTKAVPESVYYGVQSLRAAENFRITDRKSVV